ncbi:MAG TPA: 2-phosphosulfolactate phosphatase [Planctomycetaceae bacterium]|nr:2-phosphosulfolactate phosphatase [Planctomycetaceae bacterium]HRF00164.1 2-phosphosulfolactate phosphatase [Pirellulaceae bacterium]
MPSPEAERPGKIVTWFLPSLGIAAEAEGAVAVVIDVLRASTTIVTALAHGADWVRPCLEVDEASAERSSRPGSLAGGERGGLPIAGFDLGNSPGDYSEAKVAGKGIVFTTTNGTRALHAVRGAREIVIGAFVNLTALANRLAEERSILLVCAGTGGRVTREDVLFAGALAHRLECRDRERGGAERELDDMTRIARDAWVGVDGPSEGRLSDERLVDELRRTTGGRNLARLGLDRDLAQVARTDAFDLVPRFDAASGMLRRD